DGQPAPGLRLRLLRQFPQLPHRPPRGAGAARGLAAPGAMMDVATDILERRPGADTAGLREILTQVEPPGVADHRLEVAIELARRFGAVLIGLGTETCQPTVSADPCVLMGGELAVELQEAVLDDLLAAE